MTELLGQIIKSITPLKEEVLETAAQSARSVDARIGQILYEQGHIDEITLYKALAKQFSLEFISSLEQEISLEVMRELPAKLFKNGRCLPLTGSDEVLRIATSDPLDLDTVMETAAVSGLPVQTVLTPLGQLQHSHRKLFEGDSLFKQSAGKIAWEYEHKSQPQEEALSLEEMKQKTESEPVVRLASLIFDEAIKCRASDIHIEPYEHNALVRFRIDGMLRQHTEVTRYMYTPLTSRIKILADLDIAEKRVPQDGRIRYSAEGQNFDFRVSTLPTHHGEKTVIRILKHDQALLRLSNIGMSPSQLTHIKELVEKPQGMIFVTGPTGSGKSSTLFSCLNQIRNKAINITTIENPIEYKLEGINQVQINEKAGVSFASVLRSILRQDPDVILVGEIRDSETAQIAVQASQTGHLVFSTLHTNDSISAITRLRDLGIPGFLISSSLVGILAQRLVRVLCPECKREQEMSNETKTRWRTLLGSQPLPRSFSAPGCESCKGSGYKGRTGLFELVVVNEKIRSMIADNASESALRSYLSESGFKSLIQDGIAKIEQGITSPEELLRVVLVEDALHLKNVEPPL
ncbi:MAG: GspE/PulE family protein [Chitinispirillaceae bacterium]